MLAPTPDGRTAFLNLCANAKARFPALRFPTDDEAVLFGAALDAGAALVPARLREYLGGAAVLPIQWEGCHLFLEDMGNAAIEAAVTGARAARDAYLRRVREGDLRATAERVGGRLAEAA